MFPFKKPPSKLEVARKSVSDAAHHLLDAVPTEKIDEKLGDLKKSAAFAAVQAAQAAHHASELAAQKFEELQGVAIHLGEGVSKSAHGAAQTAQSAGHAAVTKAGIATVSAREGVQTARENMSEKAGTLRSSALESASALRDSLKEITAQDLKIGEKEAQNAREAAQKAAEREVQATRARAEAAKAKADAKEAQITAESAREAADKAQDEAEEQAEAAKQQAKDARKVAKAEAKAQAEAEEHAQQEARERKDRNLAALPQISGETSDIEFADSDSKWGWIVIGLALGAVLALLFAPTTGRRSRAAIKDRLGKVGEGAVDAATATSDKVVDIAHRVEGLAHKAEAKLSADSETDEDGTIADRVRSVLGHHEVAKHLERLNIDCVEGVVTLRGPILDDETQRLIITAVAGVPGVKEVISDFLTDEEPPNPKESVA